MHPAYKSAAPGIAPDCGMKLEPVFASDVRREVGSAGGNAPEAGSVSVDSWSQKIAGIRVTTVKAGTTIQTIHVSGRVFPEDGNVFQVNSGVDGFVRQTFNDSVGTVVAKNEKIAEYYSPEFLAAASGYLAANERVPGSVTSEGARSIQNYTDRLRNLGMSELQINHIATSRKLPESIEVVSPTEGVVLTKSVSAGQHFEHNMELYKIADLSKVWVVAEVDEQDQHYLRPGTMARVFRRDGTGVFSGRVTQSLSQFEAGGSTVKVRLEVENSKLNLRPEMVVGIEFPVKRPQAITVPVDSLVDSGRGEHIYVEGSPGVFTPREVETGWRDSNSVEIKSGVREGERIVASAAFLIDSESRLRTPVDFASAGATAADTRLR
jgi:Cu(I)/Ag(I) efflux system membrane fusion protein